MDYFKDYTNLLKQELIPAAGCTEPIALAYSAAEASALLPGHAKSALVRASVNLIKNAKSVLVPGTNGRYGIPISIAMGMVIAKPECKLEILSRSNDEYISKAVELVNSDSIKVELIPGVVGFYVDLIVKDDQSNEAEIILKDEHTNVVLKRLNDEVKLQKEINAEDEVKIDLSFERIMTYVRSVDLEQVSDIIENQKKLNMEIAEEGLHRNWGANIGELSQTLNDDSIISKCMAYASAGSDARMAGCNMSVVINSGSGNQGISVSVPVIVYAREKKYEEDVLNRALLLSNLLALYQKQSIGRLSAYCGAVTASCAAVAGIAFLDGCGDDIIAQTYVNGATQISGMVCDGAKASCAGKINLALYSAFLGYKQALSNNSYQSGHGIVAQDIDHTIQSIGRIAKKGMHDTDLCIVEEMLNTNS